MAPSARKLRLFWLAMAIEAMPVDRAALGVAFSLTRFSSHMAAPIIGRWTTVTADRDSWNHRRLGLLSRVHPLDKRVACRVACA